MSHTPELSTRAQRSRSYILQLEKALTLEFPVGFPIYLDEHHAPEMDQPPRIVWYPVIGEIKEPINGAHTEQFDPDGSLLDPDEPDSPGNTVISREIVGERHLNFAFEIWAGDTIEADLLVNAVYSRLKRIMPRIVRAQETWLRDDQQITLGRVVTLLISVPVPVADDDDESTEFLLSVVTRVGTKLAHDITVNSELETPPILLNP